jgi:hypothetical protein
MAQPGFAALVAGPARGSEVGCVLYRSNPQGHKGEGWNRGRCGMYHDHETWCHLVSDAGFIELSHYYPPACRARSNSGWRLGRR